MLKMSSIEEKQKLESKCVEFKNKVKSEQLFVWIADDVLISFKRDFRVYSTLYSTFWEF